MDQITVKKDKGLPTIEIVSGMANLTSFFIGIWDVPSQSWTKIGDDKDNETKFNLPPIDTLNLRKISWAVVLDSLTQQPHDTYDVTISVSQDGNDVAGSPKRYQNEFTLGADGKPRRKEIREQVEVVVQ